MRAIPTITVCGLLWTIPLGTSICAQTKDLGLPPAAHLNPDPAISYHIVAEANAQHRRNSVGSMVLLDDGRIMFVHDDYGPERSDEGAAHDFFPSKIVSQTSADGGKTWSRPRILAEPGRGDFTIQAPGVLKLASGDLLLTFVRVYKGMDTGKDWDPGVTSSTMAVYRSTDGGKTFTEEKPIWDRAPALRFQGGAPWNLQLASGRILVPYMSAPRQYTDDYSVGVALSDDGGQTWSVLDDRVKLAAGYGVEPSVVELSGGELLMSLRTNLKKVYFSRSTDGGRTWSDAVASELKNPELGTCLLRIPETDDLLIIFDDSDVQTKAGRTPMSVAISSDNGRTWRTVGNLVHGEGIEVGVDAALFLPDGTLLVAFDWTAPPGARLRIPLCVAVIDRRWLYRE